MRTILVLVILGVNIGRRIEISLSPSISYEAHTEAFTKRSRDSERS